jgi:hypothetical protein
MPIQGASTLALSEKLWSLPQSPACNKLSLWPDASGYDELEDLRGTPFLLVNL